MFCPKCGNIVNDGAKFCTSCGAKLGAASTVNQPCQDHSHPGEVKPSLDIISAVKLSMSRLTDFSGRSRRSEYWWTALVVGLATGILSSIGSSVEAILTPLSIFLLLAVSIRRLHDTGRSGWWYLLQFLPVAGQLILLVFMIKDSSPDNVYGPNPKM